MSLRARLRLSIVALVAIVVVAISALYLYDFTVLAFEAATSRADLIANHVKGYLLESVDHRTPDTGDSQPGIEQWKRTWTEAVKSDPYIRGLLRRMTASADVVLSIYVAGEDGKILVASSPFLVGMPAPAKLSFRDVQRRNAFLNLWDLFRSREDYTTTLPLGIAGQQRPVFSITVVIRSLLLENALKPAFANLERVFLGSLIVALILAFFLPGLVLSPLGRVSQRIDQIRTGDLEAIPLGPKHEAPEFAAVQSKLSLLGKQFRGAKQDALELRGNIEEMLRKLEEAVLVFDPSGRLMMAGQPAARLLGLENEELVGQNIAELFPRDTMLGEVIERAVRAQQPVHDKIVPFEPGGTRPARLLINIERLGRGAGQDSGEAAASTLITLREARTRHPSEIQLDVSSRLAAISRLTGGIAHEIKNPLNAIALHLEVLKTKLEATEPEIDVISREIRRLDKVVKTFLNFNKPPELERQAVNLSELARDIADLVRPDARAKDIQIQEQLSELTWISGDPDLIRQAVLNIVENAVDAMDRSGTLTIAAERNNAECMLTISDTGPGIPPEIRDQIFNLYFSTKQSGSGMGLALAFRAVQLHSGTIEVTSGIGEGTSFRLRFPMANSPDRDAVAHGRS